MLTAWPALAFLVSASSVPGAGSTDFAGDAKALDQLIVANYAYVDDWPGGTLPDSPTLLAEREAVRDRDGLLRYAEHRIASLADHHAITGNSFRDSWALVPTYSDMWIEVRGGRYWIDAVRQGSPAEQAGIKAGDELIAIGGVPTAKAVASFWQDIGLQPVGERLAYAARVLAAGRRDRSRVVAFARAGVTKTAELPSLYAAPVTNRAPLDVARSGNSAVIAIHNSLGDQATIEAFDRAMTGLPAKLPVTIDLTDTPSGGNTSVARAMMSWFVRRPTSYQLHQMPAEERETGVARQWIEQVLPRAGKHHPGPVTIRVGRWTGSMGEGLAIGFKALGATVCGDPMARLKGAVYDFALPSSGMIVKFPAERLYSVAGQPREEFIPDRCR